MRTSKPAQVRLLDKAEVLRIAGVSFPTLWSWMRAGKFPRARISAGGGSKSKSVWRSDEVERWIDGLQVRPLKDDSPPAKSPLNVKA
jgi:predicted DNA-binding transcriptional regulator AlpA